MSKEKKTNNDEIVISLDQFAVPGAIIVAGIVIAVAIFFTNKDKDNNIDASDPTTVAGEEADDSQYQFPSASTDIGDAPYVGNKETAKIAIVEYSDYLCGYCQRHVDETYPSIVEKYVDSGEVIYVFREFSIHGEIADAQAMGGKCVFEQKGLDTYLDYHKNAFMLDSIDAVYEVAKDIGADIQACVESDKYRDTIDTDYQAGADAGVQGTPGFVVGILDGDGNVVGKLIAGAYPLDAFEEVIESLLAE